MKINQDIYNIIEMTTLDDVNSEGYLLEHKKTSAKIILINNSDENKAFSINFRTPPENDKGTTHIIEHSVLAGSKKFPLKDPYLELVKGSLNTFLNAITYADMTAYPVASCNEDDFKNLMEVYLDGVFNPLVLEKPEIFWQEGWRYEYDSKNDTISHAGIVYSEMKGEMSSPETLLHHAINKTLFPNTPYRYMSGGMPSEITNLTFEEFKSYYNKYYHPSNAYIYLYGDMDFEERLDYIDKQYLSYYEKKKILSEIDEQVPLKSENKQYYSISKGEEETGKAYLAYTVALPIEHTPLGYMTMQLIDYALTDAALGAVTTAFTEANIGEDVWGSFIFGQKQPSYSIICMNADEDDKEEFIDIIKNSITKACSEGFDREILNAVIDRYEFAYLEDNFEDAPKGIECMEDVFKKLLYGEDDIFAFFKMKSIFDELRSLVDKVYFEQKAMELIVNNDFKAINILAPQIGLTEKQDKEKQKLLTKLWKEMTPEEKGLVKHNYQKNKEYQQKSDTKELLNLIPILDRKSLKITEKPFNNKENIINGIKTIFHEEKTHDISYINLSFNLDKLKLEDFPYVGVIADLLGDTRTKNYTHQELSKYIGKITGDFYTTIEIYDGSGANGILRPSLEIKTKLKNEKINDIYNLFEEVMWRTTFDDTDRIKELIEKLNANIEMDIQENIETILEIEAKKNICREAVVRDQVEGLTYAHFVAELLKQIKIDEDKAIRELKEKLLGLLKQVFTADNLLISFIGDRATFTSFTANYKKLKQYLDKETQEQIDKSSVINSNAINENSDNTNNKNSVMKQNTNNKATIVAYEFSSEVEYIVIAAKLKDECKKYRGTWKVASHILYCEYLWHNVRVKGGAYDCNIAFPYGEYVVMTSYRDPNMTHTLEVYKNISNYLKKFDCDDRQMRKYIIGAFNDLMQPESIRQHGQRCFEHYICGDTEQALEEIKQKLINTTPSDIRKLGNLLENIIDNSYIVVAGGKTALNKQRSMFDTVKLL